MHGQLAIFVSCLTNVFPSVVDCVGHTAVKIKYTKLILFCFSTMTSVPRATTTLKNHSYGQQGNLLVIQTWSLLRCQLLNLLRSRWIHRWQQCMRKNFKLLKLQLSRKKKIMTCSFRSMGPVSFKSEDSNYPSLYFNLILLQYLSYYILCKCPIFVMEVKQSTYK